MFVRALSGAGYTDMNPLASPDASSSTLALEQTSESEPMFANAYAGFEDQWTRFKEALLSCPDEVNGNGEVGVIDVGAGPAAGDAKTGTRVGMACLGERLSSAISRSRSGVSGPAFAKEDRAFGLSLDGIPSRRKGDDQKKRSNNEDTTRDESLPSETRRKRIHGRL